MISWGKEPIVLVEVTIELEEKKVGRGGSSR